MQSNMDPKKRTVQRLSKSLPGQQLSCMWNNMDLEEIRVREENQFSQNLLGQSCHLKIAEVPRKVTVQERDFP